MISNLDIFDVIERHDHEDLRKILNGKSIDLIGSSVNEIGQTPIQFAADQQNWPAVIAITSKYNAYPAAAKNLPNAGEALVRASQCNQLEAARVLLAAKAPVDYKHTQTGNTCLHFAAENQNVAMIILLLNEEASLRVMNHKGKYPIDIVLQNNFWKGMNAILDLAPRKNIVFKKKSLSFILREAIKANQLDTIKKLKGLGVFNNLCTSKSLKNILHLAVEKNNIPIIKLLLKHGAKQTTKNNKGQTAVALASALGYSDCVQVLIEYMHTDMNTERCVSQKDIEELQYEDALIDAVKHNQYAIVELILKQGTPCTRWNGECGNIPLYFALKNNNAQIFQLLLRYHADPYARNNRGETTFEIANRLNNRFISNKCIPILEGIKRTEPQVMKMEKYLEKLRKKIIDIDWKVQDNFGNCGRAVWEEGTPKHIGQLKNCLHKTNLSSNEIIKIFAKVKHILSSIKFNPRRHCETQKFYEENLKEMNLLELEFNQINNNNLKLSIYNPSMSNQTIFNNAAISQALLSRSLNDRDPTKSLEKMSSLNKQVVANNFPFLNSEFDPSQSGQSLASSQVSKLYPNILASKHGIGNETKGVIKENDLAQEISFSSNKPVVVSTLNYPDIHKYSQPINAGQLDQDVPDAEIKNKESVENAELRILADLEKNFPLQQNLQSQASAPHVKVNELGFFKAHNKEEKKPEQNTNFKRNRGC